MKKVLVISYNWPPAGGIGVLRTLKFVKYFRQFGWEPVIYAPKKAHYSFYDQSNFKDVPENLQVLRHSIVEPFSLYKIFSGRKWNDVINNPIQVRNKKTSVADQISIWIRGNLFIPDARSLWIGPSVRFLSSFLQNNHIDALFSDGPPHTNTVIACKLARKFRIPWLADFQDPWTQVDYYPELKLTKWADKKHKKLEQEVFNVASKITIVSPTWKNDLESIGAKDVGIVHWGYDEDDFEDITALPDNDFTIVHPGLLGYDRNPDILFRILKECKNEINGFANHLKLKFAGSIDYSVRESIRENGLEENFIDLGTITRRQAIELMFQAQLLILPLNKASNAKGRIPGKLFEFLRSKRPVLSFGPAGSDVELIINETKSGVNCEYEDYEKIKQFMLKHYTLFTEGLLKNSNEDISEYSVKNQTARIAQYLEEIVK